VGTGTEDLGKAIEKRTIMSKTVKNRTGEKRNGRMFRIVGAKEWS
jgi:hypothetical protein